MTDIDEKFEIISDYWEELGIDWSGETITQFINLMDYKYLRNKKDEKYNTFYWSRAPGMFVNRYSGESLYTSSNNLAPNFGGHLLDWYGTLADIIKDEILYLRRHHNISNDYTVKIITSPECIEILSATLNYRPNFEFANKNIIGSLFNRFLIFEDILMQRNKIEICIEHGINKLIFEINVLGMGV